MRSIISKIVLCLGLCCINTFTPLATAQVASPVFDIPNNLIGGIQKVVMTASKVVRETILPFKESVSKIQQFFKKASESVNLVIKNLKMVHDLIKVEESINRLFLKSIQQIDESESVPNKWKHRWILGQLYWESRNIFGVFDLAHTEGQGVMDDEGRIRIIQKTLKQARQVHSAMKVAIRRTNREVFKVQRQKRALEIYTTLFTKK